MAAKPSRPLLIAEFLDEIDQRAEKSFKGHLHQAFVDWYVEAEFGHHVRWDFTDGPSDGGIDALVWVPGNTPPVIILQSKFTERVGQGLLSRPSYRDFKKAVDAFYRRADAFDEFLGGVRDDLRRCYRKAFESLDGVHNWLTEKKAFRLITTNKRRSGGEFDLIPRDNFYYVEDILRLYDAYRKVRTPKPHDLRLTVRDKLCYRDKKRGVTSYLFNAQLSDIQRYLKEYDVARLIARNIRYNLGGRIGREIRKTFERTPVNFWYVHNGITIICDEFVEKNQVATLKNPSVINGAQTLYAISGSLLSNSPALVTMRVIVRGANNEAAEDDDWLQGVIRGVNTQNRVHACDFRCSEPEQIELQKRLREVRVFYERKRGEWAEFRNESRFKNFDRISLLELGQILTAVSDTEGTGVLQVKRGSEGIFEEKHYRRLFPSRSRVARRFERIYLAYRVYRLLGRVAYRSRKEKLKQHHAFWNTLWLFHLGLTSLDRFYSSTTVQALKEAFDRLEGNGLLGRHARKLVRDTRKAIWGAYRKARRSDPERWTPNNFFKSKFGNAKLLAIAFPRVRAALRSLAERLLIKT